MSTNTSDKKLNKQQQEAVEHGTGPLLIIAGAGTGKTTVITERIKYLIANGLAKPEEILALTFTEKASREMEERVDVAMPLSYGEMWIMTFHSFCDQILRESGIHIGLSPNFKLMTQAQSIDLIRKNLFEFDLDYFRPLGNPNKFIDGLLQHFSRLQDELVTVEEYLTFTKNYKNDEELEIKKTKELASAYKKYNEIKLKNNLLDFGDLISYTIKLFKDRPNILKIYQEKFKYILIDEFQDTNYSQNQLAILLAGKLANLTVVGDDDQSIYRFRGASVSNILQFRKNFPNTKIVVLTENFRSKQEILDASYKLIQFNNPDRLEIVEQIDKKLIAKCKFKKVDKDPIKFIHTKTAIDEAEVATNEILSLKNKGANWNDIAILVRANNHADMFVREFERRGIPTQFLGPSKLFEKKEIVDLISYLKVLYNPEDSESFYRLLSSEIFDIDPLTLIQITSSAKKQSKTILEIVGESENEVVKNLLNLINKHLKMLNNSSAGEILLDYVKEIGLFEKLIKDLDETKTKNISSFFERIKNYEYENKNADLRSVVDYIDLLLEVGESPIVTDPNWQEVDAVNILTAHSAKGLEFKYVFLVNLVSLRFPSTQRHEQIPIPTELIKEVLPSGDFHLQEERRLFYVGMTRAKEKLFLTASDLYGDAKREKKISPFVMEALGEIPDNKTARHQDIDTTTQKINAKVPSRQDVKIDYLSVSQIETFKTCPMHYKLRYIYKLPTAPSASISFGVSIHNTLKDFFEIKENILNMYKNNWIEEGYLNKKHKLEFYKKGEEYLLGFVKNSYNPNIKTLALEQKFNFKLNNDLKIGGTIDRVDDIGAGRIEIIDYKTGATIPTQKEVDKNLQLSVYAIAASAMYKVKPEDIKLSLYYLDTQEKISTKRTAKDLEKVKEEILKVKEGIENSDFKCNGSYFCQGKCEYSMFCKSEAF